MTRLPAAVLAALILAPAALAQQPPANNHKPTPAPAPPASVPTLNLGECTAIALERHPALKAAMHSLNAAQLGSQALGNLPRYAGWVSRDLPVRKEQATRGLAIAQAEVDNVRADIVYDVTRLYYTYVYAKQQEQTANDVIEQMEVYLEVAKEMLKKGLKPPNKQLDQFTVYALESRIDEIRLLQIKAQTGQKQALEALKQAMGVEDTFEFVPRDRELPLMGGSVTKEQVRDLALARRGELVQAAAGADAFRLEVAAQSKARGLKVPTLAAGSDLHSRPVPSAVRTDTEYRPGGITPEMPPGLVGRKEDRVARACEYAAKQNAVSEAATNLIRLEAINAYLTWEAATRRLSEARKRFDMTRKMLAESREAAATRADPELLVSNEGIAGRAQSDYVEAVYEHLKTLASLERVTAGGVCPAFPGR